MGGGILGVVHNMVYSINNATKIIIQKNQRIIPITNATIQYDGDVFKLIPEDGGEQIIINAFQYKFKPKFSFNGFVDDIFEENNVIEQINKLAGDNKNNICEVWFHSMMPNIGDSMYVNVNNKTYCIKCLFNESDTKLKIKNEDYHVQDIPYIKHAIPNTKFYLIPQKEFKEYNKAVFAKNSLVNTYETFCQQYRVIDLKYGYRYGPIIFYITNTNTRKEGKPRIKHLNNLFTHGYHYEHFALHTNKFVMQGHTWLCWCCAVMNKILAYRIVKIQQNKIITKKSLVEPLDNLFLNFNLQPKLQGKTKELKQALFNFNPHDFYTTVFKAYDQNYSYFGFFAHTFESMIFTTIGVEQLNKPHADITLEIKRYGLHYVVEVDESIETTTIIDSMQFHQDVIYKSKETGSIM